LNTSQMSLVCACYMSRSMATVMHVMHVMHVMQSLSWHEACLRLFHIPPHSSCVSKAGEQDRAAHHGVTTCCCQAHPPWACWRPFGGSSTHEHPAAADRRHPQAPMFLQHQYVQHCQPEIAQTARHAQIHRHVQHCQPAIAQSARHAQIHRHAATQRLLRPGRHADVAEEVHAAMVLPADRPDMVLSRYSHMWHGQKCLLHADITHVT